MRILLFFTVAMFFSQPLFAQNEKNDMRNLREYYFVELIKIPNRPKLDSATTTEIQMAHLNNIDSLHKSGKLVLAGPFGDEKGGGVFILKAKSLEEATEICDSDPAIKNGRLNYKVRPWWTDKTMFTSEKE